MTTDSLLVHWAGEYLRLGLRVIALEGKLPNGLVHKHGLHDYLEGAPENDADWDVVRRAFAHPKTTGVGILTGLPYVVVDIDGEEGAQQWRDIVGPEGDDDAAWIASTGRGLHLWYATPWNLRVVDEGIVGPPTMKLGPKLDLKGYGGYVAAPPSLHPSGSTYTWLLEPGAEAPMEAPEQLARLIEDRMFDLARNIEKKETFKRAWGPRFQSGDTVFYAQPGHDALIEGMKTAEDGNRNNYLHWAASTLAEEGGADEEFETLAAVALDAGLDPVEVKRTIRSARTAHG